MLFCLCLTVGWIGEALKLKLGFRLVSLFSLPWTSSLEFLLGEKKSVEVKQSLGGVCCFTLSNLDRKPVSLSESVGACLWSRQSQALLLCLNWQPSLSYGWPVYLTVKPNKEPAWLTVRQKHSAEREIECFVQSFFYIFHSLMKCL